MFDRQPSAVHHHHYDHDHHAAEQCTGVPDREEHQPDRRESLLKSLFKATHLDFRWVPLTCWLTLYHSSVIQTVEFTSGINVSRVNSVGWRIALPCPSLPFV